MTDNDKSTSEASPQRVSDLRQEIHRLPKVDLHRHLEGSLRLSTLSEIAREHGVDLPSHDINDLRRYVQITDDPPDFHRFLEKFRLLRRFYKTPEAVARVAYEAVTDAAADNVRYLELRFSPAALARTQGFSYEEVTDWVIDAVDRAQKDHAITVRLIVTIIRSEDPKNAEYITQVAIDRRDRGIVGLDLAGDEVNFDATPFVSMFQNASDKGLGITIHAGEVGGASNVEHAVKEMAATRIGHGVRAIENSDTVKLLRDENISLEICLTSNLQTGVVRNFGHHPLHDFYVLGVSVTLNTDDPSVSDTTLTDEYLVAMIVIGLNLSQMRVVNCNALRAAFLADDERRRLEKRVMAEFDQTVKDF